MAMLASALRAEGDHDLAVRSRWALALGYMGDWFAANVASLRPSENTFQLAARWPETDR